MPVQRIARYPLLLQTIQKHTDPTHPAYALLEEAAHTSIALNCRINEYKRFREVGETHLPSWTLLSYNLKAEYSVMCCFVIQLGQELISYVPQEVEEDRTANALSVGVNGRTGTALQINGSSYFNCSWQIQEDRNSNHQGQDQPPQHPQHRKEDGEAQPANQTWDWNGT